MELDTADFETLADMLQRNAQAGDGIMDFEMLDGFLCGVIVAPTPVPPGDWLPQVLGDGAFPDQQSAEAAVGALMRLYNAVTQRLAAEFDEKGEEEPPLRIYVHRLNPDGSLIEHLSEADFNQADEEAGTDPTADPEAADDDDAVAFVGALWSVGFALATQLAENDWEAAAEEWELVDEILHLSDLLLPEVPEDEDEDVEDAEDESAELPFEAQDDLGEPGEDDLPDSDEPLTTEERVIALGEMSEALHELYQLNQQRAQARQTVRRESPKVGRNDPCPCGSGRKYKFCHGAN
jgi:uncharacterized protein